MIVEIKGGVVPTCLNFWMTSVGGQLDLVVSAVNWTPWCRRNTYPLGEWGGLVWRSVCRHGAPTNPNGCVHPCEISQGCGLSCSISTIKLFSSISTSTFGVVAKAYKLSLNLATHARLLREFPKSSLRY